jgi:hypothetical protein
MAATESTSHHAAAGSGPSGPRRGAPSGALLVGSVVQGHLARGFHPSSWALGVLGFPAVLLAWQWLRARRTPTRLAVTGPVGHARNLAVFLALYLTFWYAPALEFTSDAAQSSTVARCCWRRCAATLGARC